MTPTAVSTDPPMAWPVVTIGARAFTVKFNQRVEYLASTWGYDLGSLIRVWSQPSQDNHNFAFIIQMWALCVAHEFTSATPPQKPLTPEDWMDFFEATFPVYDDFIACFKAIQTACRSAVVKRSSDRAPKAAPVPTAEVQPPSQVQ